MIHSIAEDFKEDY